jgi:hypothetical protein
MPRRLWRWLRLDCRGNALFLIVELSQPARGLFRVPPAALEQSIEEMSKKK